MNILSLYIGYITDLIIGDPYSFPHPVKYIGKLIKSVENFIRKIAKSDKGLKIGGFFLWFVTVGITFIITYEIIRLARFNMVVYVIINSIVIYTTLATKCLKDEAKKIYDVLKTGDIKKSRIQLSYIVGRDTENLSEKEIIRATVETVAENTVDGLIAPLFYAFVGACINVGGISLAAPLAMTYKAINTLDSSVGYKNEKYLHIGFASAKIDDIANYIPSRIAGLFVVLSAFCLRFDYKNSYKILKRDARNCPSPNSGFTMASAAGALDIQLIKLDTYILGDNNKNIEINDISSAVKLSKLTILLFTLAIILFIIILYVIL